MGVKPAYSKVGQTFGEWTIIEELGSGKVLCRCSCGTVKVNSKYNVINGRTKSCGCISSKLKSQANFQDLTGKTFNEWTVLKELGNDKVLCRCSCGVVKEVTKSAIKDGRSKSCGHDKNQFKDLTGKKFYNWTITKELGYGKVQCKCECGTVAVLQKATLLRGTSKSCGCLKTPLMQDTLMQRYGELTAIKVSNPREKWQIDTFNNKDKLLDFINTKYTACKPTIKELVLDLGVNEASIGRKIKEYNMYQYISFDTYSSSYEKEIMQFIKSICNYTIITNSRSIIPPHEIDIYIPEKKLAIEFNGSYWHSNIFKEKRYHQIKSIECVKHNIRLIHIFEYEWRDKEQQNKLKQLICDILSTKKVVYARDTELKVVNEEDTKDFLNKYHLQGYAQSSVNLGLYHENELLAIMTFGTPRFDNSTDYELIRLAYKSGYTITGGTNKLFKYFINTYCKGGSTIISYCDLSKFTGNTYLSIGMETEGITEPNYVWFNPSNLDLLTRYQTMKSKLIKKGLGEDKQTEDEIMYNMNYFKIYNSGNIKFRLKVLDK